MELVRIYADVTDQFQAQRFAITVGKDVEVFVGWLLTTWFIVGLSV